MYCWSCTFSSGSSLALPLIRCSRTRSRSRTITILWKNVSRGTRFSAVPSLPGLRTTSPPTQRPPSSTGFTASSSRITCLKTERNSSASMSSSSSGIWIGESSPVARAGESSLLLRALEPRCTRIRCLGCGREVNAPRCTHCPHVLVAYSGAGHTPSRHSPLRFTSPVSSISSTTRTNRAQLPQRLWRGS